jgi:hypothetical protein
MPCRQVCSGGGDHGRCSPHRHRPAQRAPGRACQDKRRCRWRPWTGPSASRLARRLRIIARSCHGSALCGSPHEQGGCSYRIILSRPLRQHIGNPHLHFAPWIRRCRASNLAEAWWVFSLWQGASPAKTRASARPSCAHGLPPAPCDTLRAMERGTWLWNTQALSCGRHQSGGEREPRRAHAPNERRQPAISSEDAGPASAARWARAPQPPALSRRSARVRHVLSPSQTHHRLILGSPARLGPAARGYPARGHGHTDGQTTACSPDR